MLPGEKKEESMCVSFRHKEMYVSTYKIYNIYKCVYKYL